MTARPVLADDVHRNPMISIIRIVSFINLGNKTGEDINCKFTSRQQPLSAC